MPNIEVVSDIKKVNFVWANSIIRAMIDHYNFSLGTIMSEIIMGQTAPNLNLGKAKSTAIRWAKANYGKKLHVKSIEAFYQFIRPFDPHFQQKAQNCQVTTPTARSSQTVPVIPPPSELRKRLRSPTDSPPPVKRTDTRPSPIFLLDSPVDPLQIPLPDSPPPLSPEEFPPLPRRVDANQKSGPRTKSTPVDPSKIPLPDTPPPLSSDELPPLPQRAKDDRKSGLRTRSTPLTQKGVSTPVPVAKLPQPNFTPTPCRNSINHQNKLKKTTHLEANSFWKFRYEVDHKHEWRLPVLTKKILILGSSNLSRINVKPHSDTQIACYPGAKLCHARTIVKKYMDSYQPEKIIINIGINDKDEPMSVTAQRVQLLFSTIRSKFPDAKVYFTKLNYSQHLTAKQKRTLAFINSSVESLRIKVSVIPSLPISDFEVVQDNIHWSEKTANALYYSWLTFLNLN
jgi:hypothetical protein